MSPGPPDDPRILYVDATAEYRAAEGWGISLVNDTVARLKGTIKCGLVRVRHRHNDLPFPEGPHFCYDSAPSLFQDRRGRGPLFVAWDTNLLLDYFKFGGDLWQSRELPVKPGSDYASELEGLQLLLALAVLRDIRFVVLPQSINDSKKLLPPGRRRPRLKAFQEFVAALNLVSGVDRMELPSREGLLILPERLLDEAVNHLPPGYDRWLVRTAVQLGIHVFLTRDAGILRHRKVLRPFGLLLASPGDLLEELVGCGACNCIFDPGGYLHWPMPDQQRIAHWIHALPGFPDNLPPLRNPSWMG